MVKDHVLNILTDPLRNYTLVELCIQNVGTQGGVAVHVIMVKDKK